ncbi:polysaccharide biosynthesis protein [Paracoccaceae bacterium]|nr:polysaccharide biosynthesis protein [Paracoccaceae bacterium]
MILNYFVRQINRAATLSRKTKISLQVVTDILLASGSFFFAILLGGMGIQTAADPAIFMGMFISVTVGILTFIWLGLYQSLVRFITDNILVVISKGVFISSCTLAVYFILKDVDIPLTVSFNYGLLLFLTTGGIRFQIRRIFRNPDKKSKKPAVIYGAGKAGLGLQNALLHNYEILPVAFIDDNPKLQGFKIGGCNVYPASAFSSIRRKYGVELILLAMPTISRQRRKQIIENFNGQNINLRTVPPMSKILTGEAEVSDLRPVAPEMLLGRDSISPVDGLLQHNITGKSVMITGAGGSIGTELCKQVLSQKPSKIILFDLSELALYQINEEMLQANKKINSTAIIVPVLGSVCDEKRVSETIKTFKVKTIYHAAAYKHVPLVEDNIVEGIRNNVFGTLTIVQQAACCNVDSFTLISTDKAVRPTNVMGASKRCAELICQAYAKETTKTKFSMVRFGNVLGSSGSVIPLFQKQIEAGGPVTVTHPEITRYFMTIGEAAQLVIQASAMSKGGDVFVLDMGTPIKIADLAADVIRLAGFQPYFQEKSAKALPEQGHIPICFTGLRNGEKLYEELLIGKNPEHTEHARIMKATEVSLPMMEMTSQLNRLREATDAFDIKAVLNILKNLPLEFTQNKNLAVGDGSIGPETEVTSHGVSQPI